MGKLIKNNKCLVDGVLPEELEEKLRDTNVLLEEKFDKAGGEIAGRTVFGSGVTINSQGTAGGLEMEGVTPYIDFHVANSTEDYTNRLLTCFNRPRFYADWLSNALDW